MSVAYNNIKTENAIAECTKCTTNPLNITISYSSSKIEAGFSKLSLVRAKNDEDESRQKHLVRGRGTT